MIALGICSAWLRYRRRLYHSRPFQWFALCMGPAGLIALVAGWVTTEMGRQPWVIYGLLRTRDAVSLQQHPADGHQPVGIYRGLLRRVWRGVLLHFPDLSKKGPQPVTELTSKTAGTPARPLSAAEPVRDEENAS